MNALKLVECPDCSGDGKHRARPAFPCGTCRGTGEISRELRDTLFNVADEWLKRPILKSDLNTTHFTGDVLGVKTDFELKQERVDDAIMLTVSWTPPRMEYDRANNILRVFPPQT